MQTIETIKEMASYCLGCKHKPCKNACPVKTDIPLFIEKIKENNIKEAYKILIDNNIFSFICSSICPFENQCEGSCTRGIKGNAVNIGKLEHWVNEYSRENKFEYNIIQKVKNRHKVAIIGSGPASLSCAYELAKEGINVTIFEKENELGGVLRYGIPVYRLDKTNLDSIISKILKLGIRVETNCELGKNITLNDLKNDGFEYIFLGIGASNPSTYILSEERLEGIYDSSSFLKRYNQSENIEKLGKTIIIGGGNVAIDCARAAVRMGSSDISILYRKDIENMPARKTEIKEALKENISIIPYTKVIRAKGNQGKLAEIECVKTALVDGRFIDMENSNYIREVDTIIFAIGLLPESRVLKNEGLSLENGLIKINELGKTNLKNVYAGGDVTRGKATVCKAIADGKNVALNILSNLK